MITRWSNSRLGTYESCPKKAFYRYIEKIEEEQHPAAERGIRIHGLAEQYIKGELEEMPRELYLFYEGFEQLRESYKEGDVSVEEQWAFNLSWEKPIGMVKTLGEDTSLMPLLNKSLMQKLLILKLDATRKITKDIKVNALYMLVVYLIDSQN